MDSDAACDRQGESERHGGHREHVRDDDDRIVDEWMIEDD